MDNFESLKAEQLSKYAGEWIAVIDKKIVAHGKSFREVYNYVKKQFPNERPLIGKLPDSVPVVLGFE